MCPGSGSASATSDRLAQVSGHLEKLVLDPNSESFPKYKDLPRYPGEPEGAAWLWGKDDELGRLNLLTPVRVLKAKEHIQLGEVIPLNLPLHLPSPPMFGRASFSHSIHRRSEFSIDDIYTTNPQSGTQWDGFRHFTHIVSKKFYNGMTAEEILTPGEKRNGIDAWARKGICASALLLDFKSWADEEGVSLEYFNSGKISLEMLEKVGKRQGVDIHKDIPVGCILLVRTGWLVADFALSEEERERIHKGPQVWGGIEASQAMAEWMHDSWFAAVASDSPSFEAWPLRKKEEGGEGWLLHEKLLACWGCPIGELWDLERLAEKCNEVKRWWVCLTSAPGNVVGGVGSAVNGMAIL
ncbi:hypothetical protein BZA77DRAFT_316615 [Pyronema omphalodes]|nr:hypothetical protein BZA77DRAFT_316615 [Pyronema omphalodes]